MDYETVFPLLQTFLALGAVLVLAYVVLRLGKKMTGEGGGYVKIVEKTMLTNQSFMAVLKVGDDYHLAGVTQGEIKILKDLDKGEVEVHLLSRQKRFEENPLTKIMKMRKNIE